MISIIEIYQISYYFEICDITHLIACHDINK